MLNIQNLVEDAKCFETVRALRWPKGLRCVHCASAAISKRGRDPMHSERQKYRGKGCGCWFDDLIGTILAGHHQPPANPGVMPVFHGREPVQPADRPRTGPSQG